MFRFLVFVLFVALSSACASTKPYQQYPAKLPAKLPADEYVGYSADGVKTHVCTPAQGGALRCRDLVSPDKPTPPAGVLVQDGIRLAGEAMSPAESLSAPRLEVKPEESTYDMQVRITRDALWLDDQKLVELEDGLVPAEHKRGGERSFFIEPLYAAGSAAGERAVAESGAPPEVIFSVDKTTKYRLFAEVVYTAGQAQLTKPPTFAAAVARDIHRLHLFCERAENTGLGELLCRPVGRQGQANKGVSSVELVTVGIIEHMMPRLRLSSAITSFCDKEDIRTTIGAARAEVAACYEQALEADRKVSGKVLVRFRIGFDGKVMSSSASQSTLDNQKMERCILDVVDGLEFPKPNGGICIIKYPFSFSATE